MTLRAFGREIRLVSFDLDDTLLDTYRSVPARVRHAIETAMPVVPSDDAMEAIARAVAAGDPDLRRDRFLAALELRREDAIATELLAAYASCDHLIQLLYGALDILDRVTQQVPVVVITNGDLDTQARRMRHYGLERFVSAVFTPGGSALRKPDPGMFWQAAEHAGVTPAAAVHIGDSLFADVQGANAAGFASVLIRSDEPHPEVVPSPLPDAVIDRLDELPALLGLS